jgi:hypothetical protein
MKKQTIRRGLVPAVAATALVLGATGLPSAGATGMQAHKAPLTQTNRACDASVIGDTRTEAFGFVNLIRPASGKLVAVVVLKGATPNTTYDIRLIQLVPGDTDCRTVDGTLTTDADGNGSATVQEKILPGATKAWIDLNNHADYTQFYDTAVLSF